MSSAPPTDSVPPDDAWRELQQLIDEVARLARSSAEPAEFYGALVDRCLRATGAVAAVLWTRTADRRFQPEFHRHVERLRLAEDPHSRTLHARLLETALHATGTTWIPAGAGETSPAAGMLNRDHALSFTPLRIDGEVFAVLELAHGPLEDPAVERACQEVLEAFVDCALDWRRTRQLGEFKQRDEFARAREQFLLDVNASLDLPTTLGEVVDGARRLLECDRVSVGMRQGSWMRIEAVSGVEKVDRRSAVVGAMEPLATIAARTGEPIWWEGPLQDMPPEIATPLNAYVDVAHPRWLALLPLAAPRRESGDAEPLAVLVLEKFAGGASAEQRVRIESVARHVAVAIGNAWEYATLPGAAWLRRLRAFTGADRQRRNKRGAAAVAIAVAVAATLLVPIEFTIAARGTLQPRVVRDVFATADGEVARLLVGHEQAVRAGQPLLQLLSPQLDLERERLSGECQTTKERLLAVESARLLDVKGGRDATPAPALSASESELRRSLESQEAQLAIVERQRGALTLASPLDGAVLTWNPLELLESRPVKRGQVLLSVGDVNGPWEARLDISDQRVGHVLRAQASTDESLPVTFVLATAPGVPYPGRLERVEHITSSDAEGQPTVKAHVAFDRKQVAPLRPGATVVAKVHCGRRPLGYVWFHELFEFLQTNVFF